MLLTRLLSRVINPESGVGGTGVWTLEAMRKLRVGQRDVRTKTPAAAPRDRSQGKIQESFIRCVQWDGDWMMPWFSNCCCDTYWTKATWGEKGYFSLHFQVTPHRWWNHGGIQLTYPLCGLVSLVSYTTQDHLPGDGTTGCGPGSPISVSKQKNVPQKHPGANLMVAVSSTEILSSQVTVSCVRLTLTLTRSRVDYMEKMGKDSFIV